MICKAINKYNQEHKCICGCDVFYISAKDNEHMMHCTQCGMYNGFRKTMEGLVEINDMDTRDK